jgi:hypothetical protein
MNRSFPFWFSRQDFVDGSGGRRCWLCQLILLCSGLINSLAEKFPTPAPRKEREGRAHQMFGDAGEIEVWATRPNLPRDGRRIEGKTTKPGWLTRLSCLKLVRRSCLDQPPRMSNPSLTVAGSPARSGAIYITIARFSSSCIRTGKAHPAISTRPAASSAALGDTP